MTVSQQQAIEAGQAGMAQAAQNAGAAFADRAAVFVLEYLAGKGPATGETLTDAAREAGIVPHNDKAFGPVIFRLSIRGQIEKCGTAPRRKGHGTSGANLWRVTDSGRAEVAPSAPVEVGHDRAVDAVFAGPGMLF